MAEINDNVVVLDVDELARGALVGMRRRIESLCSSRVSSFTRSVENEWHIDIEGALGELAVAKFLGVEWSEGVNTFGAADVGKNIQVKTTGAKTQTPHLIVTKVTPHHYYVLVIGSAPQYRIVGWILGEHILAGKFWNDFRGFPAHWVPVKALDESFSSLPISM